MDISTTLRDFIGKDERNSSGNVNNAYEACEGADVVVLFTEWNQYRALNLAELKKKMKGSVFVDLRNVYSPKQIKDAGFEYYGLGRI